MLKRTPYTERRHAGYYEPDNQKQKPKTERDADRKASSTTTSNLTGVTKTSSKS